MFWFIYCLDVSVGEWNHQNFICLLLGKHRGSSSCPEKTQRRKDSCKVSSRYHNCQAPSRRFYRKDRKEFNRPSGRRYQIFNFTYVLRPTQTPYQKEGCSRRHDRPNPDPTTWEKIRWVCTPPDPRYSKRHVKLGTKRKCLCRHSDYKI